MYIGYFMLDSQFLLYQFWFHVTEFCDPIVSGYMNNMPFSFRYFMGKGGRNSIVRRWHHLHMLESKENHL